MREQLGQEDCGDKEDGWKEDGRTEGGDWCADELDREIGEMPVEMFWTLGVDWGRENGKESGYVEGARLEDEMSTAFEMGGLGDEGYP